MNEQIKNTEVTGSTADETHATETAVNEAAPGLTAKEVFDQIVALQRQMMDQSYNSLYRMTEAVNDICGDDTFESDESRENAICEITSVFMAREENYRHLMAFYQQMYNDLKPQSEARYAERREFMNWVRDCINATQCGQDLPDFERLWNIFN